MLRKLFILLSPVGITESYAYSYYKVVRNIKLLTQDLGVVGLGYCRNGGKPLLKRRQHKAL